MLYVWYLAWAIFVMWAVILVYDQRVLDIDHSYMLEQNIPHKTGTRPTPCFNSCTICCTAKCDCFNCHILHTCFL